ncbi:MAG TPA: condensation domain-containing protein, partial [Ignavibacteriales bacterium]|nr:condensation domain-containing protein [Ignavibacteriales bacterium]
MLRSLFRWEKLEKPSLIILKEHPCRVIFYDLAENTTLQEIKNNDRRRPFDLQQVPFRVTLVKRAENEYEMIISNHHILYDGWSNGIILREFFQVYHRLSRGEQVVKIPAKPPFKEFVRWMQSRDKISREKYWREYLAGFEPPAESFLKKDCDVAAGANDYALIFEGALIDTLDAFVKNNRVTLAAIFYTAWGLLLQKYGGSEDVVFGTTVSGRSAAIEGIEDMVGLFINTIPLRIQTNAGVKMGALLARTGQMLREREGFEDTPPVDIAACSGLGSALFNTFVAIENYPLDNDLVPPGSLLSVNSYAIAESTPYDLSVGIMLH